MLLVLISLLAAGPARAERVALVLGNSDYLAAEPLANALNDARDTAAALRGIGFRVFEGANLSRQQTLALVQEFARSLGPSDTALLYYAGHAVQLGAENYLIPVEADIGDEANLARSAIKLQSVLRTMELRADARIVILDACRDNPFVTASTFRSGGLPSRGLAKIEAGVGSFIAFATQPGNTASDGNGRNSPFTAALLRHIKTPGQDIHALMRSVRSDVHRETGGLQIPWENSSLVREVFFVPNTRAQQPTTPVVTKPAQPTIPKPTQPAFPAPAQPSGTGYHYVDGLDPNGDNFLALRSAPAGAGHRVAKMGPGTLLNVLGGRGNWLNVRLKDGRTGWAHRKWIFCCRTDGQTASPHQASQNLSCDDLWYRRNAIWHKYGYCFRGARGKRTFGNDGCRRDQAGARAAMSPADAAQIDTYAAQEAAQYCR